MSETASPRDRASISRKCPWRGRRAYRDLNSLRGLVATHSERVSRLVDLQPRGLSGAQQLGNFARRPPRAELTRSEVWSMPGLPNSSRLPQGILYVQDVPTIKWSRKLTCWTCSCTARRCIADLRREASLLSSSSCFKGQNALTRIGGPPAIFDSLASCRPRSAGKLASQVTAALAEIMPLLAASPPR